MKHPIVLASALLALVGCYGSASVSSPPPSTTSAGSSDMARAQDELTAATNVLHDMTQGTEVPMDQRERAQCVIVAPDVASGAFLVGGRSGRGVVACRTATDWSPPEFVRIGGVTVGLQAGVKSADLLVLATTSEAVGRLFSSNFQFGVGTSIAVGSAGAGIQASENTRMNADFLTYARSRGLFAGVDLTGVGMKADEPLMSAVYGGNADPRTVLSGSVPVPRMATALVDQLRATFPRGNETSLPVSQR